MSNNLNTYIAITFNRDIFAPGFIRFFFPKETISFKKNIKVVRNKIQANELKQLSFFVNVQQLIIKPHVSFFIPAS